MCWSTLLQSVNKGMHRWSGKKQLPMQEATRRVPGTVRRAIKYVHLGTYLTVIKHVRERAFFCNSSKARTPVDLYVRR